MKFYIVPLFLSALLLYLYLKKSDKGERSKKNWASGFLILQCLMVCYGVFLLFQNTEQIFAFFLPVAWLCHYSTTCFIHLQEEKNLVSRRWAYAILMLFWLALVVSFSMEAMAIQRFLVSAK